MNTGRIFIKVFVVAIVFVFLVSQAGYAVDVRRGTTADSDDVQNQAGKVVDEEGKKDRFAAGHTLETPNHRIKVVSEQDVLTLPAEPLLAETVTTEDLFQVLNNPVNNGKAVVIAADSDIQARNIKAKFGDTIDQIVWLLVFPGVNLSELADLFRQHQFGTTLDMVTDEKLRELIGEQV